MYSIVLKIAPFLFCFSSKSIGAHLWVLRARLPYVKIEMSAYSNIPVSLSFGSLF